MKNNILDKNQIKVLAEIAEIPYLKDTFYLTGGTALASFYLKHRYSEDLDFFSEKEIDMLNLNGALTNLKKSVGAHVVDFEQSYNRNLFFLHFGKSVIKTEFTYFPFPQIEKGEMLNGISIDSLQDIAVNKLFTIYQRVTARDYIDLYFIIKEKNFTIENLIAKAKIKFDWHIDPIQLGTQFIKVGDAKDLPKMIKKINATTWRNFFFDEAKKLKKEVI